VRLGFLVGGAPTPHGEAVVFAALEGLTSALPLSDKGHVLAARIWLDAGGGPGSVIGAAELGAALGIGWVARRRALAALSAGVRGLARPALYDANPAGRDALTIAVFVLCAAVVRFALGGGPVLNDVPLVAGAGLLLTAAGLASTALAPPPSAVHPSTLGAAAAGLGYGVSLLPGTSPLAVAYVVVCWLGVARWQAAELCLLASLPLVGFDAVARLRAAHELELGVAVMATCVGAVAAAIGAVWWRLLCERDREGWLGLWLVPLAVALLGFSWAT
jgi:undecaprenyl pyrophosphate phosphatase UppP